MKVKGSSVCQVCATHKDHPYSAPYSYLASNCKAKYGRFKNTSGRKLEDFGFISPLDDFSPSVDVLLVTEDHCYGFYHVYSTEHCVMLNLPEDLSLICRLWNRPPHCPPAHYLRCRELSKMADGGRSGSAEISRGKSTCFWSSWRLRWTEYERCGKSKSAWNNVTGSRSDGASSGASTELEDDVSILRCPHGVGVYCDIYMVLTYFGLSPM